VKAHPWLMFSAGVFVGTVVVPIVFAGLGAALGIGAARVAATGG